MFNLKLDKKPTLNELEDGTYSFAWRSEGAIDIIEHFGRNPEATLVKVFHRPLTGEDISYYIWGKQLAPYNTISFLGEATKIQNLMAFEELAPRVYALGTIEYDELLYPFQLVESVGTYNDVTFSKEKRHELYNKIVEACKKYNITPPFGDLDTPGNVIKDKWVDWQGARFNPEYLEGLKTRVATGGIFGNGIYQTIPELEIIGMRDSNKRYEALELHKINWKEKTVHDIGCSSGLFCNYAEKSGAKKVIGTDHESVIKVARELSNWIGCYNIDYCPASLTQNYSFLGKFDIVLFLSMYRHIMLPKWVVNSVKEIFIFEKNQPDNITDEHVLNDLKVNFKTVNFIGENNDFHNREIYHCYKNSK